ncbi:MAG TPA: DUF1993 family protein [Polyangia bacterium]|jgi:hypothetical protein|nr:DUF1993 family protein [Polyangia bacterium]
MIFEAFQQMKKQLEQLEKWLEAATAHAESKKIDAKNFLGLRLVVDQLPFSFQVQTVCDTAKLAVSRLTGKPAPSHADNEESIEQLKARVRSVIGYLGDYTAADFADAATRTITQPRWEGKTMTGADYFRADDSVVRRRARVR